MAAKNDITGDSLISKANTEAYEDNYDRIFGNAKPKSGRYMQDKETGELITSQEWHQKYYKPVNKAPFVIGLMPAYQSPITGKWIESREQRREDLKRSGSRPYEGLQAEKKEAERIQVEKEKAFEDKLPGMIEKTAIQLRDGMTKPCKDPLIF